MNLSSNESADPRVLRTRRLLEDALVRLLDEKPYSEITVKNIAAAATVNRATFYAHFVDKDDLFRSFLRNSLDELLADRLESGATPSSAPEAYLRALLQAVFEYADWLTAKCRSAKPGRGVPPPEGELQTQVEHKVLWWLETVQSRRGADERRTLALATSAMIASVATRWSRSLKRSSSTVMVSHLEGMIAGAIAATVDPH